MSSSVGMITPNIWENKKCSKPTTSDGICGSIQNRIIVWSSLIHDSMEPCLFEKIYMINAIAITFRLNKWRLTWFSREHTANGIHGSTLEPSGTIHHGISWDYHEIVMLKPTIIYILRFPQVSTAWFIGFCSGETTAFRTIQFQYLFFNTYWSLSIVYPISTVFLWLIR